MNHELWLIFKFGTLLLVGGIIGWNTSRLPWWVALLIALPSTLIVTLAFHYFKP